MSERAPEPEIGLIFWFNAKIDGESWRVKATIIALMAPVDEEGKIQADALVILSVPTDNGGPWLTEWDAWWIENGAKVAVAGR